jgi:hypothetical protein
MADRNPVQPGRRRLPWGLALALALTVPGCGSRDDPQVAVSELSWACGAARCTASFRLTAARDAGAVVALVRAYDGDSVQQRAIVGEHRELLALAAGQSRRVTVALDTERPANRVRVIVEPAR